MFTTVREVYEFIDCQKPRVYTLDNFKRFMESMNHPQFKLKCIHIGGTNGKGSTTHYVSMALKQQGYKVGTFTSPYLETPLDSICINHQPIDQQFVINMANQYMNEWLKYEISKFEIEVFIAIMYFLSQDIDFAIFEVGLGGELDATNIIQPLVSAITNIGLDHMNYLGDTYKQIASTKVKIVKTGIPLITTETKEECLTIFKEECKRNHSQLITVQKAKSVLKNPLVSFKYKNFHISLNTLALYQVTNASLAIEILLYLKSLGIQIDDCSIINGLNKALWKGRFEIICQDPLVIIDGAHNNEGIEKLIESAKDLKNVKVIFAALKDKPTHSMIKQLLTLTNDITVTEFDFERACLATQLANGFDVKVDLDWKNAIKMSCSKNSTLIITGSLYFIKEVRKYFKEGGYATI